MQNRHAAKFTEARHATGGMENPPRRRGSGMRKNVERGESIMNPYQTYKPETLIRATSYAGRGILIGKSADGKKAVIVYFIMGRSANSRNRIFSEKDGALFTEPFDATKVEDPSLIIYAAERRFQNHWIVTNGDQTDTIYNGLAAGKSFSESLATRSFEPDFPHFTPRISGILTFENGDFSYEMSILKSADAQGNACCRNTFSYPALSGLGHFLHTYADDGNPLPTFSGEPRRVEIPDDIDALTDAIWDALHPDNRISLHVRSIDLTTGKERTRLINRNQV